jgi:3-oxoacyl-[acyl-carrier protein] reductase
MTTTRDSDTWALITGASRGIGAAVAETLSARGFPILLNYRGNHEAARAVQGRIEKAGGRVRPVPFDVMDHDAVTAAIEGLLEEKLSIGVVVNNAGVVRDNPFPMVKQTDWIDVTRTTLDGFYNVTRPLIMPMVKRRWGRIVNMASVSGLIGNRGQVSYSAAKAGLIGATRSLSRELAKRGITVNAVAPGLIETDMIRDAPVEEMTKQIPMRRLGRPEEVAALVAFLVSDEAAYITGPVIGINGGLA